jgi:hypothetical protein
MIVPRYVVASGAEATSVLRRLARAGWRTRDGFALAEVAWDVSGQRLGTSGRLRGGWCRSASSSSSGGRPR